MIVTTDDAYKMGHLDAIRQCFDSGSTDTPDGGWDSWLINSVGSEVVCRMFGEDQIDNEDGWSDSMASKLKSYNDGAMDGASAVRSCND